MGAFVVAGMIAVITLGIAGIQIFAISMSTTGTGDSGAGLTLFIGLSVAVMVAASHWIPHIGW